MGSSSSYPKQPERTLFPNRRQPHGTMRYISRVTAYRHARHIAGSAMNSSRGQIRLQRCRALLQEIDPDRPPTAVHAREFRWQYRALRERVHLYSERLAAAESAPPNDSGLQKAEMAIELSLQYFNDVLAPKHGIDDEEGAGD